MNIAKCDKSFNAELRKGGPLVGRTSRRVSQSFLILWFNRGPLRQHLESGAIRGSLRYGFLDNWVLKFAREGV
jgi:hypothetical protein